VLFDEEDWWGAEVVCLYTRLGGPNKDGVTVQKVMVRYDADGSEEKITYPDDEDGVRIELPGPSISPTPTSKRDRRAKKPYSGDGAGKSGEEEMEGSEEEWKEEEEEEEEQEEEDDYTPSRKKVGTGHKRAHSTQPTAKQTDRSLLPPLAESRIAAGKP
jgi:hypothetical protein